MVINAAKTQIMIINPPKEEPPEQINSIIIENNIIQHQKTIRILGFNLSEDLSMDNQIWAGEKNVIKSMNSKIALLKTIKPYLSTEALGHIGSGLINSTILYGAPVWGFTTIKNLDMIQKVQTKAARLIMSKGWQKNKKKAHRQDTLDLLKWPNTKQIVTSAILNLTKKAIDQKSS